MATHDIGRLGSNTNTILDLTIPGRSNGSDMYNDLTDVVPSQNIETFDNGTDEAGNPILGSRANDYVEQQAKAQPQSGSYVQRFATNFSNYFGRKYNDVSPAELEQYQAALDADPEGTLLFGGKPQIDLAEELSPVTWANAAKDLFGSIDSVKSGRLYANLFYGKDEYRDRILKINRITGVKMDDLINNDDAYRTMNQLVMRIEKLEKLPGFLKTNGKLDMDKVYKELPYLAAVQEKQGDTAAALALTHAAGLKSINDVYHNEFTRFAASVGYGLYKGGMNVYKQWTTGKAMARALTGGDGNLTDAEKNDLQWANNQIQSTPEFAFDSVGSAFGGMIGGAAENLPLIATSQGAKTAVKFAIRQGVKKIPVVGTALGKVADKIGNRALDVIGDISSVAAMSAGIGANQYEENLYKLDSAGNRMYTPREAAAVSMVQGVAEGVLEQYSLKQIGRAIAGGGKVIELNNLYRKGALLRTAEGRGELREQVASLVSERIGDMVKAGAVSMGAELQEEFSQQVADMVIENIAQVGLRGENAEVASFGDILQESTVAALQAMHSIAGFGVAGFMLHPVAHLRPIVTARGQIQKMMDNEAYRSVHVNQYQMNVIEGVGNNLKDISDLQKKSPETVNNILDVQNRKFGVEFTEVDVKTLMQEPGGSDIVTRIAEQGNISQEEMQACVDGHGMLKVKTSALQQLIPDMDGKQKEALLGNVTKNSTYKTDNQVVKEREVAIRQKAAIKKLMQEEVGNAIENVVKARFSDDADEATLAREILEANFDDPLAEVKQRLARANMELQEAIGTTVSRLRTSMKYPEQARNEYEAAWSQNWSDDHEGQKISDRELEELAVDIVSGREDPRYSIDAVDMENMTDEERQQLEKTGVQLDELLTLRNRLAAVQEKMKDLKPGDLVATRVLSADGQAVFQQLKNEFASKTGSDKAKKSADFNAIMWARYCEERAKAFAEATKKPYTAMDYYRERLRMNLAAEHQPLKENLEKAAQLMEMWDVSVSGIDSLPKFYDRVLERKEGEEEPNKIQYTNKYGITFAEQQVVHAVNTHGLTKDDLADIDAHIDKFYNVNHSGWADGDYAGNFNGTSILARVDGKSQSYYVVIEIDDNGVAWFKTAAKNSKDGADKKIEEHSSGRLSDLGDETAGTTGSASSIENIKQKLGIVNKITKKNKKWRVIYNGDNTLEQPAYHGTGARFDRFNTDFMGTGEGNQVHGWGLYFAADRKIAESYRNMLTNEAQNAEWGNLLETKFSGKTIQEWYDEYGRRLDRMPGSSKDYQVTQQIYELLESALLGDDIQRVIEEAEDDGGYDPKAIKWLRDKIASKYTKKQFGQVFEADIPENDVLLDEQKTLVEQPEKVKQAIRELVSGMTDEQLEDTGQDVGRIGRDKAIANIMKMFADGNGKQIYGTLTDTFGGQREASEKLNEYGVKGITYEGLTDGRCYVVFDDKAINILNKFYQEQNNAAKGSVTFSEGNPEKVLNLFETADQSTAMHEMAHVYLLDLQELANIAGPDSLYAKDLKTIMDWASWQEGQIDDYIGTATASEFLKRDSEIRAAKNAGDTAKAEELEKVWAQERFARGFEEYLEKGTAPTMGLQKAFRAFKRWLCNIYKGFLGVGGRATPEVEAVMARMIASEEEIETLSAANNIARLEKIDPEVFNTELGRMLRRWENEAKEEAKEKLLKALLKEYRELDVEGHLKEYRERMEEEMKDHHCFAVQRLVEEGATLENALATFGYASQDEYEADLKRYGKSYDAAIEKAVKAERERYKRTPVQQQALYDQALEALASGKYDTQMAELEAEILRRQQSKYNSLPAKVADAFLKVDDARAAEEVKTIKKNLTALRYAQRWNDTETNMIREMEDRLVAKDISAEEILAEFDAKYDAFKKATIENEEWIRKEWLFGVRDAAVGKSEAIRNEVRSLMAEMPVSAAMNFRLWNRKALLEGNKAWKELSKAQNKATNEPSQDEKENARNAAASKRYVRNAEQAKLNQATFSAMASEAVRIKQKIIIPMLNKIKKRQKTMSGKNFKMDANCRYFHDHLLYVYGLRASDARKPTGEDARTFAAWLLDMKDIGQFDEDIPEVIRVAMATDDQLKDYRQLTYPELQSISDFCTMLYTIGKNQNVRLTDGVSMEQVEADCTKDFLNTISYQVGRQKITQVKGAIGKYMAGLMKTETMLSILGGKEGAYIKYIYKTLADAADAEERAREKEAVAEKELVRTYYTAAEMRKICNDDLMVTDADGTKHRFEIGDDKHITKENILCMALNWGNEGNRVRLCNGLEMSEREVMDIMQQFMTEKDWQFVQAMWNHIEEFADPVSNVIEKLTGLPMKRVKGEAFTVKVGDDKEIQLAGGYYPIVYDNGKSLRQSTFEQMEQAQSMGGASVMGVGMGSTKDRASDNYKGHGPLLLELRVAHSHIQGQLHIIHSKLAVRDAYKVIADQTIANQIRNTFGPNMYDVMRENVLSCWQAPMKPREWYDDMVGKIRRNSVGAIMSYRLSTALLNLANIVYMINEIGAINSIHALFDYYDPRNWKNNRELIMNNSVFMRNRSTNMDRDLNATAEELFGHNNILTNKLADLTGERSTEAMRLIDKYSSKAIEWTDMIFSMPLYFWQFKQTYNELILDPNKSEVEAREEANYQATRLVTKVFSSNRTIDTSQVQRSRNEIVRMFTPFFSFSNMMMNAVWSKYYEGKYQKNDADGMFARFKARWGRFLASAFLDYMVGAFVETCLREGINSLTGSGDKDDWWDRVKKNYWKNATSAATGGFPVLNLITDPFSEMVVTALRDEKLSYKYGNRGSAGVIGGAIDRIVAPFQDAAKILGGSRKIDTLDMMRDVVKASDSFTGFSDTLVDAMFNTIRFATDEGYSLDNMDDLREYIAKSMFDRKLKKRQ